MILSHRSVGVSELGARLETHAAVCSYFRAHVVVREAVVSEDSLLLRAFGRRGVVGRPILTVLLEGRARLTVGDVVRWLEPGDVSVVPTKSSVVMRQEGPRYRSVVLEWDPGAPLAAGTVGQFASARLEERAVTAAVRFAERIPVVTDGAVGAREVAALLGALALAGLPVAAAPEGSLREEVDPRTAALAAALDALHSNLHGSPMLVDLDAALGLSARHVNRVVASYNARYGFNASGWRDTRNRWRLMMGATLMTAPGATAEQVALAVGYASGATFSRALSLAGLPPPGAIARAVAALGE